MTRRGRILAALLTVVLAAVMLFSLLFIALETDHDCHGEDCAVCAVLSLCHSLLRDLLTAAAAVLAFWTVRHVRLVLARGSFRVRGKSTLVSLKVKLSD